MTQHRVLQGRILTEAGWMDGELKLAADGRIESIDARLASGRAVERYLLPGFIDLHVHGGGGVDIMEGGRAAERVARLHARFGTTSLLATTMTAPPIDIEQVLRALGSSCRERQPGGARILGVHLEGPYINPGKLGAQPDDACRAVMEQVDWYRSLAPVSLITLAPEIAGHMDIIRQLAEQGVKVQLGHTLGSYEDGVQALEQGASGFTHLFNAMSGLHHREPGMVGAALAHAEYAELIPDLLHVHPGAIRAALRSIPRLYCVTDSTAAAGMPDGEYKLGSHSVTKCMGGVRLADGTLAGSTLTMDQALRNLVSIGLPLADASHRLSLYPADYLGLADRGRLAAGAWADIVAMDADLNLQQVYVEGEQIGLVDA
ncbi:N-acetylglucosamine-6-phosphate deacetylase [Chromobacterium haemolyticum]|uniref:N-acetylglucosamine-6-phosphate deacetylase n=1 Tax=Chromobacterium fluminis TaxID=3044269 RepID=A0ABX0KYP7_9NEIS|nr:N-acetylglucosamine-6-phosphate deacetylase [Chromobacterium haemolyticum]NHR03710.1 N-acetylglucosamine-6-phosphate deacetylase [Chromobacterium haemolyticum]